MVRLGSDRDRLQSADPNSHIAVTAAIPLPATIIVAVSGATEGKAPSASVKTLAVEVSAPVKSMSRSKTASTAHTNAAASTAHAVTAHAMAAHAAAVSTTHTASSMSATASSVSTAAAAVSTATAASVSTAAAASSLTA
jgi:hypothetical protein